jgi:peptide/nickel transport system substrate-binding protein
LFDEYDESFDMDGSFFLCCGDAMTRTRGELRQFSVGLAGWNTLDADALSPITGFATCVLRNSSYNWARYCNQKVVGLVQKAMKARSGKEHMAALKEAYGIVMSDTAYIPIHQQMNTWIVNKKLRFTTRSDDRTHAYDFTTR